MNRYNFLILCLFLGLLPMMAAAQESVDGTVIDSETRHPISGVVVHTFNVRKVNGRWVIEQREKILYTQAD